MLGDTGHEWERVSFVGAVTLLPFLVIGKWLGFWFQELFSIGSIWILLAIIGVFLAMYLEEWYGKIWPILPGVAWYSLWGPIHRLAVEKAGFSLALEQGLGGLPPFFELPWWSSGVFRWIVLVVLIGAGYGISHFRSNQ
jgi:hypothetical protein